MCVFSMVGDYYRPTFEPYFIPTKPLVPKPSTPAEFVPPISKDEFDRLKERVEEMAELLRAAKDYDERTGQAGCEQDEKVGLLKQVADAMGVDVSEVFS